MINSTVCQRVIWTKGKSLLAKIAIIRWRESLEDPEVANDLFGESFRHVRAEFKEFDCWDGFFIYLRGGRAGVFSIMMVSNIVCWMVIFILVRGGLIGVFNI